MKLFLTLYLNLLCGAHMEAAGLKKGKVYYSMGEVAEMFDVNQSLIRFWESKFDILKPRKNKKGNRLFTAEDIENLRLIYHLVKEKGMTLAGAQKRIKNNPEGIPRDMEVIERLQRIRAILLELRQELKMDDGEVYRDDDPDNTVFMPETAKRGIGRRLESEETGADGLTENPTELPHDYNPSIEERFGIGADDSAPDYPRHGWYVGPTDNRDGVLPFDIDDKFDDRFDDDEAKPRIIEQTLF